MFVRSTLPAFFWALVILALTILPGRYIPPLSVWDFTSFDKIAHFILYAVFLVLLMKGLTEQYTFELLRSYPAGSAFIICFSYGVLMETIQGLFMIDRYFDIFDAIANGVGCILGIFIFKFVRYKGLSEW